MQQTSNANKRIPKPNGKYLNENEYLIHKSKKIKTENQQPNLIQMPSITPELLTYFAEQLDIMQSQVDHIKKITNNTQTLDEEYNDESPDEEECERFLNEESLDEEHEEYLDEEQEYLDEEEHEEYLDEEQEYLDEEEHEEYLDEEQEYLDEEEHDEYLDEEENEEYLDEEENEEYLDEDKEESFVEEDNEDSLIEDEEDSLDEEEQEIKALEEFLNDFDEFYLVKM